MMYLSMLLLSVSSLAIAQPLYQLGPEVRFVFPSTEILGSVSSTDELDGIFFSGDPEVLLGGKVIVGLIPGIPIEMSGSYASYEPDLRYSGSFPDNVDILFRRGSLVVVSVGLSRRLAGVRILAGADVFLYRETWSEDNQASYGGFHREYTETVAGPYVGAVKRFEVSLAELEIDFRLHLPGFSERWVSSGISVLFD